MNNRLEELKKAFDAVAAQRDPGGCRHMYEIPEHILAGARKAAIEPQPENPLKDLPKEPMDKTVYTAYLKKTALITMSLEARLPDETTRLLSGNFEEADEAMSLFFGYLVACGFHPGSVTRAMRGFLDSCDE